MYLIMKFIYGINYFQTHTYKINRNRQKIQKPRFINYCCHKFLVRI